MNILVSDEHYEIYLMDEIKKYIKENNLQLRVHSCTQTGKDFFVSCSMSINETEEYIELTCS